MGSRRSVLLLLLFFSFACFLQYGEFFSGVQAACPEKENKETCEADESGCEFCTLEYCATSKACKETCAELIEEECKRAKTKCEWGGDPAACKAIADPKPEEPGDCAKVAVGECDKNGCYQCEFLNNCVDDAKSCPSQCTDISTSEKCGMATSCVYCNVIKQCRLGKVEDCPEACTNLKETECNTSVCSWCALNSRCEETSTCPSCDQLAEEACVKAANQCAYCTNFKSCVSLVPNNADSCASCNILNTQQCNAATNCTYCTFGYCADNVNGTAAVCQTTCTGLSFLSCQSASACSWYPINSLCLSSPPSEEAITSCSNLVKKKDCELNKNCQWCGNVKFCALMNENYCPEKCNTIILSSYCAQADKCKWRDKKSECTKKKKTGMIIGIIFGCIAFILIVGFIVYFFFLRK